jgi:hypothetical protein
VSAVRGGVPTIALSTGGEAALPSAAPRGGVAVRASSASASLLYVVSHKMIPRFYVLGFGMEKWVLCNTYGTGAVTL